ncbi:MAG: vitamin K epoxide reductase family protein [Desulfobacterales bacterium]
MDAHPLSLQRSRQLPASFSSRGAAITALVGAGISLSLVVSHYRVFTDPAYESFCAISQSLNCETVSQSPWALLLGVPVAAWALLGYFVFLGFVLIRFDRPPATAGLPSLSFAVAAGFVGYSLFLAGISSFVIGSYCLLCMGLYVVNFALLGWSWSLYRKRNCPSFCKALALDLLHIFQTKTGRALLATIVAAVGALTLFYPAYWETRPFALSTALPSGLTAEGRPWIGATEPAVEIVEFADYLCFQCRKMHFHLRRLVERYPEKIRLVHVHYPMDHEVNPAVQVPFHIGAGRLAMLAIYAAGQGRFWQVNDLLYAMSESRREIDLHEISARTGLATNGLAASLEDRAIREKLRADLSLAASVGVEATPTFLVQGRTYVGTIPEEVFRDIVR